MPEPSSNPIVAAGNISNPRKPVTVPDFLSARSRGVKLTVLTAYDYTFAKLLDSAGVDALLVGDSLGMVVQGHDTSLTVTLEEMIYHTHLVARGTEHALIIADMPFMSFQVSAQQALANAGRLVKEGFAHAVKLEGGRRTADAIRAITAADIPVMGHVGLTPQSVHRFGGFRVQRDAEHLMDDALAVQEAGAFSLVLECVPSETAAKITSRLRIPTIGIGAGPSCDGQVLVAHDMLGLFEEIRPRFVKRYAELGQAIGQAVEEYCREVRAGKYPGPEHGFK
ncbi:MAG: 3-methyl-2-oxobutanoate hydroxymethyltransferase [Planctomycetes bacterium]|nr:3-methyl-2-oxobutanoate hydroxymethyltransferase [Planctomycetota bacterium]